MSRGRTILLFLLTHLLAVTFCAAQTSGYMGKRMYAKVMANYPVGYAFTQLTAKGLSSPAPFPEASLELNYVVNNSIAVGLQGGYFRAFRTYRFETDPGNFLTRDTSVALMAGTRIGGHLRWFLYRGVGNLAPLGPFLSIRANRAQYHIIDQEDKNQVNGVPLDDKRTAWFIQPGVGSNMILADRLMLSGMCEVGIGGNEYGFFANQLPDESGLEPELKHRSFTDRYLFASFSLQFSVGVGVLIF